MKLLNFCASAFLFATTVIATSCNHDNCFRALFPTATPSAISMASSFCMSIASSPATITNYPTRATSACGTSPSRYSSACACLDTVMCDICHSNGQPVRNGGFEMGLAPWVVNTTNRGMFQVSGPADTGKDSLAFISNQSTADLNPPSLQQTVSVTANQQYTLSFATWFSDEDAGFIGLMLNGQAVFTDDARDTTCCMVWKQRSITYTPTSASLTIRFEFLASSGTHTFRLDDVALN